DRTYLKNFGDMTVDWQKKYDVNYWKWDGFADRSQYNSFPATDGVPGYANNHMTGGYNHMYHVTDLWEGWIDIFERARQSEQEDGIKNLWLSLTCYVNPSPWFLQWANSVWLQCTHDRGDVGPLSNKMDTMLTYREAVYYDFIKNHQFQFPLANLYNHDPIYGTEGTGITKNSMTDEQFANYLYMMSTRGTGFWELYYSDSIMTDGKYEVTGEFLAWAEENFHILKNAKMIGKNPAEGVVLGGISQKGTYNAYGFSAWDKEEGIISMRNPDSKAKEITFTLDRNIGLADSLNGKTIIKTTIHSYNMPDGADDAYQTLNYGDTVTITLQPGETRIWSLSTKEDTKAPTITNISTDGDKTITVKFDEKVNGKLFRVEGQKISKISKSADRITYDILLAEAPKSGTTLKVSASDIEDLAGNKASTKATSITYYENNVVVSKADVSETTQVENGLEGNGSYSVAAGITTTENNMVVASQADAYTLGIDEQGKAYIQMQDARATSKIAVNDGVKHTICAVKENNGMLKLYIDGELDSSAYSAANKDYMIKKSNTIVGEAGKQATIDLQVYDLGYGYDEVKELANPSTDRKPLSNLSATVEGGTSEGDIKNIFDNNPTTFWTSTKATSGIAVGNPSVTIDLNGVYMIDRFDYTKRFYDSVENMWKCTGNLRDYTIEVSEDGTTWTKVAEGETFKDETLNEKGNGGTTEITFTPVKAAFVRISGTKSYHWQAENENKFMTIGDVKVFGEKVEATNIALNKNVTGKWTKDGSDVTVNTDKPLSNIVNGGKDTNSYADFGADNKDESAYVQIDLGKISDVEKINLYRYFADSRTYKGSVIALSKTSDFKESDVIYNSDSDNVHGFGSGKDSTYRESASGKSFVLDKTYSARYVRVYMHGSSAGKTNHIVEVEVFGYQDETAPSLVDSSALIDRLIELNEVDLTNVTANSKKAFKDAQKKAFALLDQVETQEQITAMVEELKDVEKLLVDTKGLQDAITAAEEVYAKKTTSSAKDLRAYIDQVKALFVDGTKESIAEAVLELQNKQTDEKLVDRGNTSALSDLIDSFASLKEFDYTASSWATYKAALQNAVTIVEDNSDVDQKAVDNALNSLRDAKEKLVKADAVEVDKSALAETIANVKAIDKEAFTTSSYQPLSNLYEKALEAIDSNTVTQAQVDELNKALQTAITKLVARADVSTGKGLLQEMKDKQLNEQQFTTSSWNAYANAKQALENAVNNNADVNADQLKQLCDALTKAFNALQKRVDVSSLTALYNDNKDRTNKNYTKDSWKAYSLIKAESLKALSETSINQKDIDDICKKLDLAIKSLVSINTKPNESVDENTLQSLNDFVKQVAGLNMSKYSKNTQTKILKLEKEIANALASGKMSQKEA
ncbi:MAG: discoidin domain-containing protein, partial [Longicatena sp.]